MTKRLHISDDLALPLSFVTSTQAILAKKRVGKSYTAQVQAEELLEAGQQIVVIDPTSAWWGLRSSADGKRAGYPITILGGEHGDAALELDSGKVVAEAIVTDRFSAVLDLSLFDDVDWSRFIADFLSTLYRLNRDAMHLFIDEADVACPQTVEDKAQQQALRATNNIVRRGGIKGIGCTLISQRAALVNKNVVSQVDQIVALQMNSPLDLDQVKKWVKVHDVEDQASEMIASLPSLPKGDAWVWAPAAGIFKRVAIRRKHTFDSGRTPEPGEASSSPRVLALVDVKKLGKAIAATVERIEANDPKALKKRVAELEARIAGGVAPPRVIEKRIITEAELRRLAEAADKCDELSKRVDTACTELHDELQLLTGEVIDLRAAIHLADQLPNGEPVKVVKPRVSTNLPPELVPDALAIAANRRATAKIGAPKEPPRREEAPSAPIDTQSILDALATLEAIDLDATFAVLAAWLGRHPKNKTLLTSIGALRTDGLVDGLKLTGNGRAVSRATKPTPAEQRAKLFGGISESQRVILDTIATLVAKGRPTSHAALAAWVCTHPKNKNLLGDIGNLRDRGFLDGNALTAMGERAALPRFTSKTAEDLLGALDDSQQQIARVVLARGSVGTMGELADAANLHPKNKNLLGALGTLRDRGLFTNGWPLKPTSVFPGVAS